MVAAVAITSVTFYRPKPYGTLIFERLGRGPPKSIRTHSWGELSGEL